MIGPLGHSSSSWPQFGPSLIIIIIVLAVVAVVIVIAVKCLTFLFYLHKFTPSLIQRPQAKNKSEVQVSYMPRMSYSWFCRNYCSRESLSEHKKGVCFEGDLIIRRQGGLKVTIKDICSYVHLKLRMI